MPSGLVHGRAQGTRQRCSLPPQAVRGRQVSALSRLLTQVRLWALGEFPHFPLPGLGVFSGRRRPGAGQLEAPSWATRAAPVKRLRLQNPQEESFGSYTPGGCAPGNGCLVHRVWLGASRGDSSSRCKGKATGPVALYSRARCHDNQLFLQNLTHCHD